ncbi:carbamoyltransferase HypF [Sulfurovum sp. bin170]|uniref:carbamoyltransferase HypF n=1 Tax=Sulfurovum sp. bin170 TaxID=2695268 RepID=UPI0013DF0850|nr:carbamoyltransferase HypF [Sulfurovum sp. bin170]NEW59996.1 carbamoyltransferase HypF [Sulfurovum sp. bin170]
MFHIEIRGMVQGVGFRPYIYNLALTFGLKGYVTNSGYGVLIVVDTTKGSLKKFIEAIKETAPPLSHIESIEFKLVEERERFSEFTIQKSKKQTKLSLQIPVDIAMCQACQKELNDKNNRRYHYPFISCVNCGSRFSIIKNLPYDRDKTSMSKFKMCQKCQDEYNNPKDRRYHAQPIGCFDCGATLSNSIDETVKFILEGKIVAIKGIGGYHLVCDATNEKSLQRLRAKKQRPSKPFAIMVKDMAIVKKIAMVNRAEEQLLTSNRRPIVLLKKLHPPHLTLSTLIAPLINQIGLFLPYTPIHELILQKLDRPLVTTSANLSGEPLCTTYKEIMKLSNIWDYALDHDRDIVNGCDDSVLFVEHETTFILRNARGYAPTYLQLPFKTDRKILTLGANQKNTIAICIDNRVILSPYIGDLNSLSTVQNFKSQIERLKRIYNFEPDIIVCDKHPHYASTQYAKVLKSKNYNLQLIQIQHHHAHILATMGINRITSKVLGVSFDGTGYGDDGNLWGGEFLICDQHEYKRVGHFRYFRLLGGEKAIKEPRRVALAFLFEIYGEQVFDIESDVTKSFSLIELKTLYITWQKGLNAPWSSSCGRLFDAVASLLNIVQVCSYEGESGLLLESFYNENIRDHYRFYFDDGQIDFSNIVIQILEESDRNRAVSKFFNTLVEIIVAMYQKYNLPLVLGGGVFQNRVLLRLIMDKIPNVILPKDFVSNDGAIAYGQAMGVLTSKWG